MSTIFIERVELENYKCFDNHAITLATPDGSTAGSGLTVLIGENGAGKTALLEAINYATQSTFAAENRLQIHDFTDYLKPIQVNLITTPFTCKMSAPYIDHRFDSDGIHFRAKNRTSKSRGKLLSSPFSISSQFRTPTDRYRNSKGEEQNKPIPPLHKMFSNSSIEDGELNVFYFDKNRTRQLSQGTYKTTFERICDDLNWKFLKALEDEDVDQLLKNITGEYFEHVLSLSQKGAGHRLGEEASTFFEDEQYKNLRLEFVDLLRPFSHAFFSIREDDSLQQIAPKNLGSGVEIILTLLLLKNVASQSKGGIVYLLDEPELHLHPKAQTKLVDLLLDEAKTKQVVVCTHSPYLLKGCMESTVQKVILRQTEHGEIEIDDSTSLAAGPFPWSPSWGEINFVAYGIGTVEYLNEIYGWIQEQQGAYTEADLEAYLHANGIVKDKKWIRMKNGTAQAPYDVTCPTYVRNRIHHPENRNNREFTTEELERAIKELRQVA